MKTTEYNTLLDYFRKWTAETPDAAAVYDQGKTLTFHELDRLSDELAVRLVTDVPLDAFIGLSASKNSIAIIGMLAIVKSGKAYLPLDPTYPIERISVMVQDANIRYVICNSTENALFEALNLIPVNSNYSPSSGKMVSVPPSFTLPGAGELVALLYTSGSTGVPKGVCMTHAGMFNLIKHQLHKSKATRGSQNLLFSHLSFDASFQEIFVS